MYTAAVLHGSKEQRIIDQGHDKLSTYGLLKEFPQPAVRLWIEQLVQQKFLVRVGEYHQLTITPEGRNLLKGLVVPRLLSPVKKGAKTKQDKSKNQQSSRLMDELLDDIEQQLFEKLRTLRLDLAKQKHFAPFMIFPDSTLAEMSLRKPQTNSSFSRITGVGQKKLQDYGEAFLTLIQAFCSSHNLAEAMHKKMPDQETSGTEGSSGAKKSVSSGNVLKALELFRSGLAVNDVAQRIDLAPRTVTEYLARLVEEKLISNITPWVSPEDQAKVETAVRETGSEKLKPVFLHLEEKIGYDVIRVVMASMKANS
jgi:ATP-dependent DNA helicase RecQ